MSKKEFDNSTEVLLFITDYAKMGSITGPISMAIFHIPLFINKKVKFYKLLGCGKNGSFGLTPDLAKWAIMIFEDSTATKELSSDLDAKRLPGKFILGWWKIWGGETRVFRLKPFTGHGSWDGFSYKHQPDGVDPGSGKVAVLTRASIRLNKLFRFWKFVPAAATQLKKQAGLHFTIGIGEIPFIKQATFSVWNSIESIKNYAYQQPIHKEIVRLTKKENWYSEEMFVRFKVIEEHIIKL